MLNLEQKELLEKLNSFISNNQNGLFGVYGSGGTGKTYTVTRIENASQFTFLAPTNKAANVVSENLKDKGINNKCITVDRFLGYKITKDENDKDVINYKNMDEIIPETVIVIDEVSLLNYNHFEKIQELSKKCKIIAIGDYLQLPPVESDKFKKYLNKDGFECSKIFSIIDNYFHLTIQNRQKSESYLFSKITDLRSAMKKSIPFQLCKNLGNGKDIRFMQINSKEFEDFVKNESFTILAYKKNSVSYLGYKVGSIRTGDKKFNIRKLNAGSDYYFDTSCMLEKRTFYTSETVKITYLTEKTVEFIFPVTKKVFNEKIKIAGIKCLNDDFVGEVYLPNSDLRSKMYREKKKCQNSGKYSKSELILINTFYQSFISKFAHLKSVIGSTIHKSQGSTYDTVVIPLFDFPEIPTNYKSVNQLFYVGMSRASAKVVFVDGNHNFSNSSNRVSFNLVERNLIASNSEYKCNNCETIFKDDRDFEIDHINPLGKKINGQIIGNNSIDNLQALCKNCHKDKHKAIKKND